MNPIPNLLSQFVADPASSDIPICHTAGWDIDSLIDIAEIVRCSATRSAAESWLKKKGFRLSFASTLRHGSIPSALVTEIRHRIVADWEEYVHKATGLEGRNVRFFISTHVLQEATLALTAKRYNTDRAGAVEYVHSPHISQRSSEENDRSWCIKTSAMFLQYQRANNRAQLLPMERDGTHICFDTLCNCEERFDNGRIALNHLNNYCVRCNTNLQSSTAFALHLNTCKAAPTCRECDETFHTAADCKEHARVKHGLVSGFTWLNRAKK